MKLCLFTIGIYLFQIVIVNSFPVNEQNDATIYLQKFGYFDDSKGVTPRIFPSQDSISMALKDFQRFAGLTQTGKLDPETKNMMNTPRCGLKDKIGHRRRRRRRYALQGSKWQISTFTYRISNYPTRDINKTEVDKEISRAFKIWSDVTNLSFEERKRGRVNIEIRFETGRHGDANPFDGPGRTLAHAFFPKFGGDVHFDDEEVWTIDDTFGINVFQIAAHQFGHSLGLFHSDEKEAVMTPIYLGYRPIFKLHADDVEGIQALYGDKPLPTSSVKPNSLPTSPLSSPPSSTPSSPSSSPLDTSDAPDLCQDASIDAATRTMDGSTYVFKGDFYWKILPTGIADGYPRKISADWVGLEGNLDAAYTWSDGRTYFLKGGRYWRFINKKIDGNYPQPLSVGFGNGIPQDIDAAVLWSGDQKSYFFKGDQYWRYDSEDDPTEDEKFPRPISNWEGVPNSIDAALSGGNSTTYFFKGDKFYAYDDVNFKVESEDPPYPRSTAAWFFKCPPPKPVEVPDLCLDASIDAATYTEDGSAYVFKGDFYWKILPTGLADGYPRKINVDWNGLEGNLDAAYTWIDGKTYFFKGGRYWQFFNKEMDNGYPQPLSERFGNVPRDLDAAVLWNGDRKSYFFKGNQYWRYDSKYDPPKTEKFPKAMSEWEGLPDSVDAALQGENSVTYFFKGDKYYAYNDISFKVEPQDPPYPRSTASWLFKCPPPKIVEAPDLCMDASIDAATRTEDGSAYVFKGDFYWKILPTGIADGYPRKINVDWNGLEGNLDAAYTWIDGKTIFIKGDRYWQFFNKEMDKDFPQPLSVRFENGIPQDIDAAVLWSGDMKSYFFKGNQYWRYDTKYDPPKTEKFPKPISEWTGLPDSVDAALQGENSVTYFFKGDKYYEYNDKSFKVESQDPPFPRSTADWLFKCSPHQSDAPDLCLDASIDAATRTQDGSSYVFKGDFYWKILSTGIANGYPRKINDDWDGLEGNLDAAYTWTDGRIYFIKDGRYWRFLNKEMDDGYPRPLSFRFGNGIPSNIDAAVLWRGDSKSYFFKGDQYWRYDSEDDPPKTEKFPKPISEWTGLTDSVDAALEGENSVTYFFKGDKYYAYNDASFKVESEDPPYPRSTAVWLFKCK